MPTFEAVFRVTLDADSLAEAERQAEQLGDEIVPLSFVRGLVEDGVTELAD